MPDSTYDPSAFPPVFVTVDIVVFTLVDAPDPNGKDGATRKQLNLLMIERGQEPFIGALALPGGFVKQDEDLETAAVRELGEETNIELPAHRLHQLHAYGRPNRDERARVVSVAYVALVADIGEPEGGSDAFDARLVPVRDIESENMSLAFDHAQIITDALEYVRRLIEETSAAVDFCGDYFTMAELRDVYQAVWRFPLERTGFHKRVTGIPGFVERADSAPGDCLLMAPMAMVVSAPTANEKPTRGRPPTYFRPGDAETLSPPLRRPKPMMKDSQSYFSQSAWSSDSPSDSPR